MPTGLLFGWLAARGLLAPWLAEEVGADAQQIRDGSLTGPAAWGRVGAVLTREGVSDEARELVDWLYFGREKLWMTYLAAELAADLPSLYHIPDSPESQALASEFLDEVWADWQDE